MQIKENMKLSILIPAYNASKSIERCLNSIIEQYISGVEVIVINDGSTDSTLSILNDYAEKFNYINVYSQDNVGVSASRNKLIKKASGEYVNFLDADDWIEYGSLSKLVCYLNSNNPDILIMDYVRVSSDYIKRINVQDFSIVEGQYTSQQFLDVFATEKVTTAVWNKVFKYPLIEKLSFPESVTLGEDLCFLIKAILLANVIEKYNLAYVNYLDNPAGITSNNIASKIYQLESVFAEISDKLQVEFPSVEDKDFLYATECHHALQILFLKPCNNREYQLGLSYVIDLLKRRGNKRYIGFKKWQIILITLTRILPTKLTIIAVATIVTLALKTVSFLR